MLKLPVGIVRISLFESDGYIPDLTTQYQKIGEVILSDTEGIENGDTLFFDEYSYRPFEFNGETYHLVDTSSGLWGILKSDGSSK